LVVLEQSELILAADDWIEKFGWLSSYAETEQAARIELIVRGHLRENYW
jgi:hypothetical protein